MTPLTFFSTADTEHESKDHDMSTTTTITPTVSPYAHANEIAVRGRVGVHCLTCDWHPLDEAPNATTSVRNTRGRLVGICHEHLMHVQSFLDDYGTRMTGHRYPVYVVGSNMPGYSPEPDNMHALHTGTDELNDTLVQSFLDDIVRSVEQTIEALQLDADMRAMPDADEDTYAYALSDVELADEISGAVGVVESLQSTTYDSMGGEIRRGVLDAIKRGHEYGYGVNVADEARNFYVAPCADDWPVCAEFDEYGTCDDGCTPRP